MNLSSNQTSKPIAPFTYLATWFTTQGLVVVATIYLMHW